MPNEGSYGGRIVVRRSGSVLWQVEAREFPKDRDTDGTLEYAIRVAGSDRNSFTSRDGKCMIIVNAEKSSLNKQGPGTDKAKFLIVSGYETPDTPYDSLVVGKSYFITYGRYIPLEASPTLVNPAVSADRPAILSICDETPWDQTPDDPDQIPFTYDLSLRYDDYDLERAGLPADLDPDKLEVCYQNFVSLRDIYRHYSCKNRLLLTNVRARADASALDKESLVDAYETTVDSLQNTLIWTKTYRHLEEFGVERDLLDDITELLRNPAQTHEAHDGEASAKAGKRPPSDVVFSRWLSVIKSPPATGQEPKNSGSTQPSPDPLEITADDLAATPGKPVISVDEILAVPGSRTITLRGLKQPGTFVLMYHGELAHYERHERAD